MKKRIKRLVASFVSGVLFVSTLLGNSVPSFATVSTDEESLNIPKELFDETSVATSSNALESGMVLSALNYEEYGDYRFEVLDNGTVEIKKYYGSDSSVRIPSVIDGKTVTSIGNRAFINIETMVEVIIPETIETIGSEAFRNCLFSSIVIPEGVISIGDNAFNYCKNLTDIQLPETLKTLGNAVFCNCDSLETITIPDSVTEIGSSLFQRCKRLKYVELPDHLTSLPLYMFTECPCITNLDMIPENVTCIEMHAFQESGLTEFTIPDGITTIETYAFANLYLRKVVFPKSIAFIEDDAFLLLNSLNEKKEMNTEFHFTGDAPKLSENCFRDIVATIYYPKHNPTWTDDILQSMYGGIITWVGYDGEAEENEISQLGWVKLDDSVLTYYRNGERLKDGAYYLHCFDEKGNIYEGYWRFDSEGIVQTGLIDGKYYYASNDGKYPYGMSIPLENAEDVIAKIKPYIMLGNYEFIETTLMDSLNLWDYFILGSPDEGLKTLIGSVLQNYLQSNAKGLLPERLFGDLSFRASIRLKYIQDVGKNKKVLKDLLETKMEDDLLSENKTFKVVKDEAEGIMGLQAKDFEKLLEEKRKEYKKNPNGKWSDSYKEMMKAMDENDENSYLAYVIEQNIKFYSALLERSDEWEKANYDYSAFIDFLDNIIEVASRLNEKGAIEGGNALISAATELKSNYENIWRITVANQIFDCIEMSDGWSEVITGESKGDIVTWDFNENAVVNGIDILSELTKKGIKELLPSFDIASKLVSELQKIDGRAAILESLAEMQDINEIAYDILKAETDIIESGNAQPQDYVNYFSAFDFMRLVVLARYNYAKDYYSATGNTEPDRKVIVEFLESEIEKLNNMTPFNYLSYAPGAYKGEWNDVEKRYYYTNGLYLKDGWKQINNETYYFDKDGRTLLGLQTITDSRGTYEYYFSTGAGNIEANKAHYGVLQKGEIVLEDGKEYFFAPETGRMVKNCVIEIHLGKYKYYDENGVYVPGKIYEGIAPPALPERVPFDNGIRTYKINCPVDVTVYDSSMTKVAALIDDTAQNVESSDVFVEIDANEQKVIYTPLDKAYIIQIEATGAGYMDYSIMEYVNESDIRKMDYRNIPLSKGKMFLGTTEKIENTSATMHQWTYYLENDDEYEYLTEVQENLSLYTIDLSVDGSGKVSGDKMAIRGDYVKLIAYPESGYKFDGWYNTDGECISKEVEYRMRVLESIHLIARFSPENSGSSLESISSESTTQSDSQDGRYLDKLKASVYGGTWEKDYIGWKLRLDGNNGYARNQWAMVKGLWYLFDASGHMMIGWQLVNHTWYYLDPVNGDMKTGWIKVDGVWYYLDPVNGDMKTGWKQIEGFWYYLNPISDGTMGSLYVNTVTPDGYRVNVDGQWVEE